MAADKRNDVWLISQLLHVEKSKGFLGGYTFRRRRRTNTQILQCILEYESEDMLRYISAKRNSILNNQMINGDCTNSLFAVRFTNINNNIYKNLFPDQFQSNSQIINLYGAFKCASRGGGGYHCFLIYKSPAYLDVFRTFPNQTKKLLLAATQLESAQQCRVKGRTRTCFTR